MAGYSQSAHRADSLFTLSLNLQNVGQYDSALKVLQQGRTTPGLLKDNYYNTKYFNHAGKCYLKSLQFKEAEECFKAALTSNERERYPKELITTYLGLHALKTFDSESDEEVYYVNEAVKLTKEFNITEFNPYIDFGFGNANFSSNIHAAKKYYLRALKEFPQNADLIEFYYTYINFLIESNELDSADYYINTAITYCTKNYPKYTLGLAECYRMKGYLAHVQDNLTEAEEIYKHKALALLSDNESDGAEYIRSDVYKLLSVLKYTLGEFYKSLQYAEKNVEIKLHQLGDRHNRTGEAFKGIADILYLLNLPNKSNDYIIRGIEIFKNCNNSLYLSQTYLQLAEAAISNSNATTALKYSDQSLYHSNKLIKINYAKAYGHYYKTLAYLMMNKMDSSMIQIDEALKVGVAFGEYSLANCQLYNIKGLILEIMGQPDSAVSFFQKSVGILDQINRAHIVKLRTKNLYAGFLIRQNKPDQALSLLISNLKDLGINLEDELREQALPYKTEISNTFKLIANGYYLKYETHNNMDDYKQVLKYSELCMKLMFDNKYGFASLPDKLYQQSLGRGIFPIAIEALYNGYTEHNSSLYLRSAFEYCEKSKSSVLLETLNANSAHTKFMDLPDSLLTKEATYKKNISNLRSKLLYTDDSNSGYHQKLVKAEAEYEKLMTGIEKNYPEYYTLKYNFDVLTIHDVQQKLNSKEALIEYFNADDQTYSFIITKDTAFFQALPPVKQSQIEAYRNALNPDFLNQSPSLIFDEYTASAHDLYLQILSPLLEKIDTNKINTLKIIPDGLLSLIPFETLITAPHQGITGDYKSLSYLMKQFNISYGYSSTSLFKMSDTKKSNNGSVLAFAPTELLQTKETAGLSVLKWNQTEVLDLENIFNSYTSTGLSATEAHFKEKIQQYPIAHLAMHAVVNHEDPMYSKLLFAPPKDTLEDGMLHTFELYNMHLNTQMVVLSACNSGYGKLQKGEGVMSLSRAFAYAGCPSVVMSHWAVDDKSTAQLMKYFYQHLAEGEDKDIALKNAKMDFLNNSSPLYHHPYYWNNFVVLGDVKPVNEPNNSYQLLIMFFLFIVIAVGFYWYVRYRKKSLHLIP